MVAALLGRELGTGLTRDPIAEHRLLPLKLAGLVIGVDPVGDLSSRIRLRNISTNQSELESSCVPP